MPAIERYTGVLYDALDVESLSGAAASRARSRLAVGSALFGLLRADDAVPAYRLSAGSKLPGGATLAARWRPVLEPVLARLAPDELVVDLRSGSYAALGRLPGAVDVDVVAEHADGRRTVVSHFNKAHKGRLARVLASSRSEPGDAAAVAALARRAGMRVERTGNELIVVVPPEPLRPWEHGSERPEQFDGVAVRVGDEHPAHAGHRRELGRRLDDLVAGGLDLGGDAREGSARRW